MPQGQLMGIHGGLVQALVGHKKIFIRAHPERLACLSPARRPACISDESCDSRSRAESCREKPDSRSAEREDHHRCSYHQRRAHLHPCRPVSRARRNRPHVQRVSWLAS